MLRTSSYLRVLGSACRRGGTKGMLTLPHAEDQTPARSDGDGAALGRVRFGYFQHMFDVNFPADYC